VNKEREGGDARLKGSHHPLRFLTSILCSINTKQKNQGKLVAKEATLPSLYPFGFVFFLRKTPYPPIFESAPEVTASKVDKKAEKQIQPDTASLKTKQTLTKEKGREKRE
jgi:hypothetical protein